MAKNATFCGATHDDEARSAEARAPTLEHAVRDLDVGFALVDRHGALLFANRAFERYLHGKLQSAGLRDAFARPEAASVHLDTEGGDPVRLQLSSCAQGYRLIIAEPGGRAGDSGPDFDAHSGRSGRSHPASGSYRRLARQACLSTSSPPSAVILVGLDRLPEVRDLHGYDAGETLYRLALKRVHSAVRSEDVVVRYGENELSIVQAGADQPGASEAVAFRIVELIGRSFLVEGRQININARVGIAVSHGRENPDILISKAGIALRQAAASGPGAFRVFDPEMQSRAAERQSLETHLRRALGLKELSLLYQPQLDVCSGRVCGFEALMRWNSRQLGAISPAIFIPLAEEIGVIDAMGAWAIVKACREAAAWRGDSHIAVNVSPVQFQSDGIVDTVRRALAQSGLAPERLEIEITEGVLMTGAASALQRLQAIRDLGVGIAMDDFGTGYSSLSYLNSFPFSKIKIDQAFVRADQDPKSKALIAAIVALASSLDMRTVAEGVETREQLAELAALGCDQVQGYLIGKPVPLSEAARFLDENFGRHVQGGIADEG